ncbi:hypothetical protein CMO96_04075 [Candidatus Woesebacteria bacterium]|nr:hypothetical protein [Candidatus Woesebacteria bacterium]
MKRLSKKGMTLVELLVVFAVFVVIIAITQQALFASLRGTSKTEVASKVKQNANYVVSVMERALHSAKDVSCVNNRVDYTSVEDGKKYYFSCEEGNVTLGGSALNSNETTVSSNPPCSITCSPEGGTTSVVIDMTFQQAGEGSGLRAEEKASHQVKTSILLRN